MTDHSLPLLSPEEEAMLAGECGPGVQRAMEIVVALGRIYRAHRLLPVTSVQVAGVSYRNLGEAGLEFLSEWAAQGARVRVPTTLNPAGMDLSAWRELGFAPSFADRQLAVIATFSKLGVRTTCTCTPYLVGNVPGSGEHVAWAESSAVAYANAVLGARTNREGGPSALAAAITGRTPAYGLHLDENRRATLRVLVRCPVRTLSDFGALGYLVGKRARNGVPCFLGLEGASDAALKALGAAMAASGAVALYHVIGVTPESDRPDLLSPDCEPFVVDELSSAYAALNADAREIDLVWFGCPHADLEEIREIAHSIGGRRLRSKLWVTVAREVRELAAKEGLAEALESAGGRLVSDMCVAIAPVKELGLRTLATPSAKGAVYASSHAGLKVRYGSVEQCVEAAVAGRWPG
ncbi:MAG: aconitase X catalytic domain-containing protein [Anaerolineae bacterium]|nr:aconitase X catalytic domain-containing protein [Anaerolineae bacterium]